MAVAIGALLLVACSGESSKGGRDGIATTLGRWRTIPAAPLAARIFASNVWTGTELLIWGGRACPAPGCVDESAAPFADGATFNPTTGTWRSLPAAPLSPRSRATALWTGKEVLLWGGDSPNLQAVSDGAAFDPVARTWRVMAASPLTSRTFRVTWTGKEMLAWGTVDGTDDRVDGVAYDPATNSWRPMAPSPLSARILPASDWTGTEILLWGGQSGDTYLADGAAYNPATDLWRPLAKSPLSGRATNGMWTGKELLVWGGEGLTAAFADGAAYDPVADHWRAMRPSPLAARRGFAEELAGAKLIVWGGAAPTGPSFYGNGAIYDSAGDKWKGMAPSGARFIPNVHWTGNELLVWGGLVVNPTSNAVEPSLDGARFTP